MGDLAFQEAGHDLDPGEGVLNLVGDRRGHLSKRCEAIAQALSLLDLLDPREVLEEQHCAGHVAVVVNDAGECVSQDLARPLQPQLGPIGRWLSSYAEARIWVNSCPAPSTSANERPTWFGSGVSPRVR